MPCRRELALSGKIAVVTGGTQGLGESIAKMFAVRGAAGVVLCGRSRGDGERIAREVAASGCEAIFVEADLAKLDDINTVTSTADKAFGRIDVLVNAAGNKSRGTIDETSEELFNSIFDVNVKAPFFLIKNVSKIMIREKKGGAIINIQSMAVHGGAAFAPAYSASKAALAALTKNAANSLAPQKIKVNGLNIGWMATASEDRIMRSYHNAADNWIELAARSAPFGRLLHPDEVARACVYLATEESGLMTGSNIDFDQIVIGTTRHRN